MKDIKDYLHLFTGCKLLRIDCNKVFTPSNVFVWNHYANDNDLFKPILRPLSSMTEDECEMYGVDSDGGEPMYGTISSDCIVGGRHQIFEITRIAEIVKELCKAGFDCFELIEAGSAIDVTTLK